VGDYLTRRGAVFHLTLRLAAKGHVGEHLTKGRAVRHMAVGVGALGTLVRVDEQHKLLLDDFAFFRINCCSCLHTIVFVSEIFAFEFWDLLSINVLFLIL
jgi:hypothetical protein